MILNFVFIVYAALNTNGTCALDTETLNYRKLMQLYSVQKERNKPESVSCSSCTSSLASHILTYRTDTWHWCYWVTCLLVILFSCDIYPNRVMDWSTSGAVNKKKTKTKKFGKFKCKTRAFNFCCVKRSANHDGVTAAAWLLSRLSSTAVQCAKERAWGLTCRRILLKPKTS